MKHMKTWLAAALAMLMVLAMAAGAMAATVTVPSDGILKDHSFTAYQIFSGREEGGVLSDVQWGGGIDSTAFLAALKADTTYSSLFTACTDAAAVAKVLSDNNTDTALANAVAKLAYAKKTGEGTALTSGENELADGYYLVVDTTANVGQGGAYNTALLQVVGKINITVKTDAPTVEKKVKDINDSTDDAMTDWQDSADYDIGDSVPFQLKATLANNVSAYTTYKVVFHDTLSKGLTYNNDAKVYIDGTETSGFSVTSTVNADGTTTLTVSCDDVKDLGAGNRSVITVEYTATLNENAVLGSAGNPNKVKLDYSNNPNKSESGNNETGTTPEDVVIVFTYKTIINKVTKNPEYDPEVEGSKEYIPLTGAEFTLEKYNKEAGEWETITVVKNDDGTTFTFSGLDDGNYRLTETKTPAGYNSIAPIEFTVTAEHDVLSDNPALTSLSGNATTGELTFTSNTTEGSLSADVVNEAGATLPETGGMGTTLFYVVGGVLVIGAVALLIVRRRKKA